LLRPDDAGFGLLEDHDDTQAKPGQPGWTLTAWARSQRHERRAHDDDHAIRPQISGITATTITDRRETGAINIVKHVEGLVAGADHSVAVAAG
jgi:hypothetical protein